MTPLPPTKPRSRRKIIGWSVAGGVFLVLLLLWFIGVVVGPPNPVAQDAGSRSALGSSPAPTVTTAVPAVARTTPPPSTTRPPAPPPKPTTVAPTFHADKARAAALLAADDNHYRNQFADGQSAFDTPGFAQWYQATTKDLTDENDLKTAEAILGSVNNDQLSAWFEASSQLTSDINQWANSALMAEPGNQTAQMTTLTKSVQTDLVTADHAAAAVGQ